MILESRTSFCIKEHVMTTNILIIDQDPSTLKTFEALMSREDIRFRQVTSGKEGLEVALKEIPSLVVISVELKDMNGFMVCKKMKEDKGLQSTPILICSSELGEKEFNKHKKLKTHADRYLQKPLASEELIRDVGDLLSIDFQLELEEDLDLDLDRLLDENDLLDNSFDMEEEHAPMTLDHVSIIQEMKTKLENQAHQLDYYKKELDASKLFFNQMKESQSSDSVELSKKEQECERLQFEIKELKEERERTLQTVQGLKEENKQTVIKLERSEEAAKELSHDLDKKDSEVKSLEDRILELEFEIESAGEAQLDGDKEKKALEVKSQNLEANLFKTQEIIDEMTSRIDAREQASKTREIVFQDEIKELESALEASKKTNERLEELLLDRESDIQEVQKKLSEFQKKAGQFDVEAKQLQEENVRIKSEYSTAISKMNEDFQELLATTKSTAEEEMNLKMDEIQEQADKQIDELNKHLFDADQESELLKERIDAILKEKKEREDELQKERLDLEEFYQNEKAKIEQTVLDKETEIQNLKSRYEEQKNIIEEVNGECEKFKIEKEDAQSQLVRAQEEKVVIQRTHDEEIRKLEQHHLKNAEEFEVKLKQAYGLQEELCEQRDLLKTELEEQEKRIKDVKAEAEEKEKKLEEELENNEKRTAKIISEQGARIADMTSEVDELKTELDRRKQESDSLTKRVSQLGLGHRTLKDRLNKAQSILEEGLKHLRGDTETLDFEE
ncbi:MAG: hypothetical protein CR997_13160 [Acidobacteria bacterium]|nr:MAG: hypothetical protein CR997_13160 [Acidobacteriota bacterium]